MKYIMIIMVLTTTFIFTGCTKTTTTPITKQSPIEEPMVTETPAEKSFGENFADEDYEEYSEEEYYDDELYEDELYEEMTSSEEITPEPENNSDSSTSVTGTWYTDGYDEENNYAMSYKIELTSDGKASCTGYRNKDTGTYSVNGNIVTITFDHCETDTPGEGFSIVNGFTYTINMTVNGDDAEIVINAPDTISNLENGTIHRKSDIIGKNSETKEGDEGEGSIIKDGEYITDAVYKGDISSDGATISIETALSHYDDNWNTIQDYEKRVYVLSTSKDCKCVIYQEEKEEYPVSEQVQFINEFLEGNSELPITLKIKNGEITEIGFSS